MFGNTPARNMADPDQKGLPDDWDVATGRNIRWVSQLGSQTYAGPVVAGGQVFVGTNNQGERNPKLTGDRGNLMVFDAATGSLRWQAAHAKLEAGAVNDWPLQGICSTPYVDGDRVYYVSNRAEVVCADADGFRDGKNDGPFATESDVSDIGADFIWTMDMLETRDVFPHNMAAGSPLVVGDLVYVTTGNGVDEDHSRLPSPQAPSFLAVDRNTGKVVWESSMPGDAILHGTWSNAAYGVIRGQPQVIFGGGDGRVYSFDPNTGKLLWTFDGNPKDAIHEVGGQGTRSEIISTPVVWEDKVYVALGQDPEHGEGVGHLYAIDASKRGDITESGRIWHRGGEDYHRSISTPAITADGTLYAADLSGYLYCLDARTGELFWTYDAYAAIWGSPYVADGKIYLGDEDGDIAILRAGRKLELIREINVGGSVYTTPKGNDGTLYIAARTKLFAIQTGARSSSP
jgi:outer membrane protein assembly factor BamB